MSENNANNSGLQSGHWEAEKDGKHHFCMVSGGYVCVGSRPVGSKDFTVENSSNCEIEKFAGASEVHKFLETNLGDKILGEVKGKVAVLVENRNRKTEAPGTDS